MLHTVLLSDLPEGFRALLDRLAREGGEIVVSDEGRPVARVVAAHREPGLDAGRIRIGDDFDTPLPEDVLDGFET